MLGDGGVDLESLEGFGNDSLAFLVGKGRVGRVLELVDRLAFVVVAYPSLESGESAGVRIEELLLELFDLQGLA